MWLGLFANERRRRRREFYVIRRRKVESKYSLRWYKFAKDGGIERHIRSLHGYEGVWFMFSLRTGSAGLLHRTRGGVGCVVMMDA